MPSSNFPTAYDAARAFGQTLQSVVSCLIHGKVTIRLERPQVLCSAVLNDGNPAVLKSTATPRVWLWVAHNYRAVPIADSPANGWMVATTAYYYAFTPSEAQKPEIIAYHWHPEAEGALRWPHLHVGNVWMGDKSTFSPHWHVPSGRVALEHVLRFAIREFGVVPIEEEFDIIFDEALTQFEQDQSWAVMPTR